VKVISKVELTRKTIIFFLGTSFIKRGYQVKTSTPQHGSKFKSVRKITKIELVRLFQIFVI